MPIHHQERYVIFALSQSIVKHLASPNLLSPIQATSRLAHTMSLAMLAAKTVLLISKVVVSLAPARP